MGLSVLLELSSLSFTKIGIGLTISKTASSGEGRSLGFICLMGPLSGMKMMGSFSRSLSEFISEKKIFNFFTIVIATSVNFHFG